MSETIEPRKTCYICNRAGDTCLCSGIRPFASPIHFVFVVHPKEARNRVGTVRIAHLSTKGSQMIIGKGNELDSNERFLELLRNPELYPAILFPGPKSQAIETMPKDWIPSGKRLAVVVIDGTWSHAKHMIRSSQFLSALPRIAFIPDSPSNYQFRVQPKPYCLSTVEAVHAVIEKMDQAQICAAPANRAHDTMLAVFKDLVRCQLSHGKLTPGSLAKG